MPQKPSEQTAPVKPIALALEESAIIIDPGHPLFERMLPLIALVNRRDVGQCCLVLVEGISRQYIAVSATNEAVAPFAIWPVPLNATSMRQLVVH